MRLRPRLDKLERAREPQKSTYPNAKAELLRRMKRADPETKARVLEAISGRKA